MSHHFRIGRRALALIGIAALSATASAQTFQDTPAQIPSGANNASRSENVDFGDVDLDGDFDVVMSDGGDCCNDQNRIWINQGGAQGGTIGFFTDTTATQFPNVLDQGRDIEFVDFDNDGDLDIYSSNTSQTNNQTNRWLTNQGNLQGGTIGFYTDETLIRWVGLNSPNSSISAGQLLGGGGFIDFSCDCDFADLDNDGDIDLVHSSYGGAFGGQIPTRLFLNDGLGFFTEHNPSGFKLTGQLIANGNPAIWAEGTHQSNTNNSTGVNADVASSALDIDLGDVDGDYDFDILHGARQEAPRFFKSRLADTGTLIWRDVTSAVYPVGYTSGNGHYEQEFGDFDNDNDLDIYGLNWFNNFTDETLKNNGSGVFGNLVTLPSSQADDNEGDFGDYDNDGDLDLFVCNFSGQDKLYRNNLIPSGTFSYSTVQSEIPGNLNQTGLDADWGDIDNDGDYDILVGYDFNAPNKLLKNVSQIADTHAPRVTNLEQAPNRAPSAVPTVVRVYVYDNAPYYFTWYNPTTLEYRVNAGPWIPVTMQSSQGQIFRGEIPGGVIGTVEYRVTSQDQEGNSSTSASKSYLSSVTGGAAQYCTQTLPTSVPSCFANLFVTDLTLATGTWDTTSIPRSGTLAAAGSTFGIYIYNDTTVGQSTFSTTNPFGTLCLNGFKRSFPACAPLLVSHPTWTPGAGACTSSVASLPVLCGTGALGLNVGDDLNIQFWFRDPTSTSAGQARFSNAVFYTLL